MTLWPETYHVTIQRLIPRCRHCKGRVFKTRWVRDDDSSSYRLYFYCHKTEHHVFLPYAEIAAGVRAQADIESQKDWPLARLIVKWFTSGPGEVL